MRTSAKPTRDYSVLGAYAMATDLLRGFGIVPMWCFFTCASQATLLITNIYHAQVFIPLSLAMSTIVMG